MEVHRKDLVVDNHRDSVVGYRVERHRDPAVDCKDPEEEDHTGLVVGRKVPAEAFHRAGYHTLNWGLDLGHQTCEFSSGRRVYSNKRSACPRWIPRSRRAKTKG